MPYYTVGDYYGRGDYYEGDPGILGALGGFAKGIVRTFVPGGGAVVNAAEAVFRRKPASTALAPLHPQTMAPLPEIPQVSAPISTGIGTGGLVGIGVGSMGGGGGVGASMPAGMPGPTGMALVCAPKGHRGHLNKSTYVTRGGGTSRWPRSLVVHPKGSECVGPRRMNVANPRALRRAIRRAKGFAKLARRVMSFPIQKPPKGRGLFKKRR